jgi:hypothetical protein
MRRLVIMSKFDLGVRTLEDSKSIAVEDIDSQSSKGGRRDRTYRAALAYSAGNDLYSYRAVSPCCSQGKWKDKGRKKGEQGYKCKISKGEYSFSLEEARKSLG